MHQYIEALSRFLVTLIKKEPSMLESVTVSLQELVNQNRRALSSKVDASESNYFIIKDPISEFRDLPSYSKKSATKNIKAFASCSKKLLEVLVELFCDSPPDKRLYLKNAIGCLASITDSSITKKIFSSLLERFELINDVGEFEKLEDHSQAMSDKDKGNLSSAERDQKRHVMIELASSLVEGAKEDLIDLIYDFLRHTLQGTDVIGHGSAYYTMSRMLEEHAWFCSSRLTKLIDLLLGLKSPGDFESLRGRFAAFRVLMVHLLKGSLEEEDRKVFLVLNEIILTLKDSNEEARKIAYDTLLAMSSSLKDPLCVSLDSPFHKLITMVMGYLSGSSPQIKSGAISALSVLLYQDPDICLSIPDLVPSILSLLQAKALEIIKAALGFMKVLVSCVEVKDLHGLLSDIALGVLPWSSVSRNHFRSKVIIILEIMVRKCGTAAVQSVTPDKYKGFLKTVLENRHGKTTSKEVDPTDIGPSPTDLSSERKQKMKCTDFGKSSDRNGSSESGKRMRQNKRIHRTDEPRVSKWSRNSNNKEPEKNYPRGKGNNEKRSFAKDSAKLGKRKMEHVKGGKKEKSGHEHQSKSKFQKHENFGKKKQKNI